MLVHLVDVSGASGRDPVEDFDTIRRELALFRRRRSLAQAAARRRQQDRRARRAGRGWPRCRRAPTRSALPFFRDLGRHRRGRRRRCSKRPGRTWRRARGRDGAASRPPTTRRRPRHRIADRRRGWACSAARSIPSTTGHLGRRPRRTRRARPRPASCWSRRTSRRTGGRPARVRRYIGSRWPRIAAADEPGWTVSDVELERDGPSYTYDTLRRSGRRARAASQIFFIIGADAFRGNRHLVALPGRARPAHFVVVLAPRHDA